MAEIVICRAVTEMNVIEVMIIGNYRHLIAMGVGVDLKTGSLIIVNRVLIIDIVVIITAVEGSDRYESYGSGRSNNRNCRGNDYRDNRDNRNWFGNTAGSGNNRRDTNYHSGAGSGNNRRDTNYHSGAGSRQRNFRHGHRDVREDSRGGSTSTPSRSTKYNSHSARETSESGVGCKSKIMSNNNNGKIWMPINNSNGYHGGRFFLFY
uniref:Uncharacterized protein n=1 Tax=Glossina morsitans morsitans TaxID=37546 RepID=A0A1B0G7R3_GLOMM